MPSVADSSPPVVGIPRSAEPSSDEPAAKDGRVGLQSAAVYAVGAALPRAIGFITLPIFTHVIGPDRYGVFALLLSISSAVGIVFSLGLDVALFRLFFQLEHDREHQVRLVNSLWTVLIVVPIAGSLVVGLAAWPLLPGASRITGPDLLFALVGTGLSIAATAIPLAVLRAERRLGAFLVVSTVATVASSGLSLLFVLAFDWGITGWLLAAVVANVVTLATAVVAVPFDRPRPFDTQLVRRAIGFGGPLVPHAFAQWALQVADRIVIAGIVASSALGVYSLGSNFGLPVLLLVQSVNYGFMPSYARAGADERDRAGLAEVVVLQAATVAFVCLACALLAPPFVNLATPASYDGAAALVPWIALGYGFLGLYYIPMNGISLGGGRTRFVAVATLTAAGANIGLLYLLVPNGGVRAAAIASALGYAVLLVAIFVYAWRPENPVAYRWRELGVIAAVVVVAYAAAQLTAAEDGGVQSLAIRTGWLLAAVAAVALSRTRGRAAFRRGIRTIGLERA